MICAGAARPRALRVERAGAVRVQAVTGILLMLHYRPDPDGAFESVGAALLLAAIPVLADPPVHLTYDDFYYQGPLYGPTGPVVCGGSPILESRRSFGYPRRTGTGSMRTAAS